MKKCIMLSIILLFVLIVNANSQNDFPRIIQYQGIISEDNKLINGPADVTFTIYNAEKNGVALWEETHTGVEVSKGVFTVQIGSINELNDLQFNQQYWIGISVNNDAEIPTRIPFTSSAYSMNAHTVSGKILSSAKIDNGMVVKSVNNITDHVKLKGDGSTKVIREGNTIIVYTPNIRDAKVRIQNENDTLGAYLDSTMFARNDTLINIKDSGITADKIKSGNIQEAHLADSSVSTDKLQDGSVDFFKLADSAVYTNHLIDSAVSTAKLADDAVTTTKLIDNAVTTDKIIDDAVTTAKIVDDAVTTTKIVDDAVTTPKIVDDAITTAKIIDDAVTTAKIVDDAVTTAKIVDDAVTTAKIVDDAVTTAKIVDDAVTTAKIVDDAVTTAKIVDDAVTTNKVIDDAITSSKIADDAVTTTKILDGTIVNADVDAAAAIEGTKIDPDFGSQNVQTTGTLTAGNTTITGTSTLQGNVIAENDLRVDGILDLDGSVDADVTTFDVDASGAVTIDAGAASNITTTTGAITISGASGVAIQENGTNVMAIADDQDVLFSTTGGSTTDPDVEVDGYAKFDGTTEFDGNVQVDGDLDVNSNTVTVDASSIDLASTGDVNIEAANDINLLNDVKIGADGQDGTLELHSEQGGTDYSVKFQPHATMTQDIVFTLPSDDGDVNRFLSTDGNGNLFWNQLNYSPALIDTDNDTKVLVEKNPDEDIIRFEVAGADHSAMDSDGLGIGTMDPTVALDVVGDVKTAGATVDVDATGAVTIDAGAASNLTTTAGALTLDGNGGVNINGNAAEVDVTTTGTLDLNAGATTLDATSLDVTSAGAVNVSGTSIGLQNNVTIGANGNDGTLTIFSEQGGTDYTTTVQPNAAMTQNVTLTLPADDGDLNQSLVTDGNGNLSWQEFSAKELKDADNDTKVQVEESADEDIIRFDAAGAEIVAIDPDGLGIGTSNPTIALDVVGAGKFTNNLEVDGILDLDGSVDADVSTLDVDATGAVTIDAAAGSNFSTAAGTVTIDGASGVNIAGNANEVDITTTGALDLNAAATTLDASSFTVNSTGANSITGGAASGVTTTAGALTLDGAGGVNVVGNAAEVDVTTTGALDLNTGATTLDASSVTVTSTGANSITGGAASDFSTTNGAITIDGANGVDIQENGTTVINVADDQDVLFATTGGGTADPDVEVDGYARFDGTTEFDGNVQVDGNIDANGTTVDVDAAGSVTIDAGAASNLTTSAGALTLDGAGGVNVVGNAAEVDVTTTGALDLNSGAMTLDASTVDVTSAGAVNVTGTSVNFLNDVTIGANGSDGTLEIFSEQGATDYSVTVQPHTTMTQDVTLTLPADDGSADQVLTTDGSGALTWETPVTNAIFDADNDTKVQVEESADEDIIRFDAAGAEVAAIDPDGLGIGTSNPTMALDVVGAGRFTTNLEVDGTTDLDGSVDADVTTFDVDASGAVTVDAGAASNLTTSAGALTLDGAGGVNIAGNAAEVDVTTTGALDLNAGATTLDAASLSVNSTGANSITAGAASNVTTTAGALTLDGAGGINVVGNASEVDMTTTGDVDINAANATIDATSAISLDAGAASNLTTSAGALTLDGAGGVNIAGNAAEVDVTTTGALDLNTGATTLDASSVTVTTTGANSITAGAASDFSTSAGAITVNGATGVDIQENGSSIITVADDQDVLFAATGGGTADPDVEVDGYARFDGATEFDGNVQVDGTIDANGATLDADASGAITLDAGATSNFTTTAGALTLDGAGGVNIAGNAAEVDVTTTGDVDVNATNATIDATSAISMDAGAASNLTTSAGALTLDGAGGVNIAGNAAEIDVTTTGALDLNSGAMTLDASTIDVTSAGAVNVAGTSVNLLNNVTIGADGNDGALEIFSEQGATDYSVTVQPNAAMTQDVTLTLPADDGTNNQVLTTDGSGALSWTSPNTTSLLDTDSDTRVQVEESADEDIIRFDAAGAEIAAIDPDGLGIGTSNPTMALDVVGAGRFTTNLEVDGITDLDGSVDADVTTFDVDASGAVTVDAGAASNVTTSVGALTLDGAGGVNIAGNAAEIDVTTTGALDLNTGATTLDASSVTVTTTGANSITAGAASDFSTSAGAITVNGATGVDIQENGSSIITVADDQDVLFAATGGGTADPDVEVDGYARFDGTTEFDGTVQTDGAIDANGATLDVDASGAVTVDAGSISLDAGAASNFTTSAGALTINGAGGINLAGNAAEVDVTTTGDVDVNAANATVDATSAISLDAAAASNFTTSAGALTLDGAGGLNIAGNAAEVDVTTTGALDLNSGAMTLDASTVDVTSAGAVNITGTSINVLNDLTVGADGSDGTLSLYSEQGGTDYSVTFQPHATMTGNVTYTLPADDGTGNQVLTTDGAGALSWNSPNTVSLVDADSDTKVQVEESADEDIIRFDAAGAEIMAVDADGLGIGKSDPTIALDVVGAGKFTTNLEVDGITDLDGSVDADVTTFDIDGSGAITLDAGAASNFTTSVGALTIDGAGGVNIAGNAAEVDVTTTGALDLNTGATTLDASSVTVTTTGANSITAGAASDFSTSAGAITVNGATGVDIQENGSSIITVADDQDVLFAATGGGTADPDVEVDGYARFDGTTEFDGTVQTDGAIDANGATLDADASGAITLDAGAASNFTTSAGALTIDGAGGINLLGNAAEVDVTTTGDVDVNAANATVDATSAISLDAGAASNFTTSAGALTLDGAGGLNIAGNAAEVDVTTTGALDLNSGAMTLDASTVDVTSAGAVNITGTSINLLNDVTVGADGNDGTISIFSEQGATDYTTTIQPNAAMTQNVTLTLPADDGASNQVLTTDGSGALSWTSQNSTSLIDADSDTQIQVEESADEDIIRFDAAGTEIMAMDADGLGIGTSNPTIALDVVGAGKFTTNLEVDAILDLDGSVDADITTFDVDASGAVTVDAGAASNFTTSAGALTLDGAGGVNIAGNAAEVDVTTTGNVDVNVANATIDATSAISLDAAAASNFTTSAGAITVDGAAGINIAGNAAEVDVTTTGALDLNSGAMTLDASTVDVTSAGAVNITGTSINLLNDVTVGADGNDGTISIFSEQGATDYTTTIQPNAAMTQNVTLTLPADDGTANQVLTTDGSGALSWNSPNTVSLVDADSDTKVQVEESADEDIIRFDAGGAEIMAVDVDGLGIGTSNPTIALDVVGAGKFTTNLEVDAILDLDGSVDADVTTFDIDGSGAITLDAGAASNLTTSAGALTLDGAGGINLAGNAAEVDVTTTGDVDVNVANATVDATSAISLDAGAASNFTTSAGALTLNGAGGVSLLNDVTIGADGNDGTLTLYSEQGGTDYSVVFQPHATMNGNVTYTLPADDGNANQVLTTDGSGALSWSSQNTSSLLDADSDTQIQVEESADEDIIRFDAGGAEIMAMDADGLGIGKSDPTIALDVVGAGKFTTNLEVDAILDLDGSVDADVTTFDIDGSGAITLDAGAASNLTTSAGALTLDGAGGINLAGNAAEVDVTTTGDVDVNVANATVDATSAISLDAGAASNFTTSAGALTLNGAGGVSLLNDVTIGADGNDGTLTLYSEQGGTDYSVVFQPHATMTGNVTYTLPADDGNANQVLTTDGSGALSWSSQNTSSLLDADSDTQIQVEESADEDIIRFDAGGAEIMAMDADGLGIGKSDPTIALDVVGAGKFTTNLEVDAILDLDGSVDADVTTFDIDGSGAITLDAGAASNFTTSAGALTLDGAGGVNIVGNAAEVDVTTTGALDLNSGAMTLDASSVTITSSGNINLLNDVVVGANGNDGTIVIYSEQGATDYSLTIQPHATMTGNVTYTLPADDGTANQVLTTDGSGALSWSSQNTSSLLDADSDTQIQVEESVDEDIIRFDAGGAEIMAMDADGLGIGKSNPTIALDVVGAGKFTTNLEVDAILDLDGSVDADVTTFDVDGSGAITLDAGAASNFTTSAGALTLNGAGGINLAGNAAEVDVTTTGDIDVNVANATVDATSAISLDAGAASNFTTSAGALTLSGAGGVNLLNDVTIGANGNDGTLTLYSEQGGTDYSVVFQPHGTMTGNVTYTLPADDGTANQVLTTDGSGGLSWAASGSASVTAIEDADTDTKIQVEESGDEDIIRFDAAGAEIMAMDADGLGIGKSDPTIALDVVGAGKFTTNLEVDAILDLDGSVDADVTTFDIDGSGAITFDAGAASNFTTSVGALTLSGASGVNLLNDVTIGANGNDGTLTLYSEQGGTDYTVVFQPHGTMTGNVTYTLPADDGTANQVLTTDGAGALSWANSGAGSVAAIEDTDADTKIQVEESGDEDIIRFDAAGAEIMAVDADGLGIGKSDPTIALDVVGAGKFTTNLEVDAILDLDGSVDADVTTFDIDGSGAITLDAGAASNFTTSVGALTLNGASGVSLLNDVTIGANGSDGTLTIYSEQGGTDYTVAFQPHATMTGNVTYTLPADDGTANQVLTTDGSGALSWASSGAGTATAIEDADADTKIQVEESGDEDIIRFDAAGAEIMAIDADGLGIGKSNPTMALDVSGSASITGSATLGDATGDQIIMEGTIRGNSSGNVIIQLGQ